MSKSIPYVIREDIVTKKRHSAEKASFNILIMFFFSAVTLLLPPSETLAEMGNVQIIAGAGPSTKVVESFVKHLSRHEAAKGQTFSVPGKSIKHAGGIRSTEKNLFGRTGRPLNAKEMEEGVEEIFLAKMPIVFAAGAKAGVSSLTLDQVCGIFTGKHKNWKDVGGNDSEIVIISREPTEALFLELKKDVPCMNNVVTKYILKKDNHVVEMLRGSDVGQSAIGFGAARNFPEKVHISVDGFDSGVRLGLVFRTVNGGQALVQAARDVAGSSDWKAELKKMGLGLP